MRNALALVFFALAGFALWVRHAPTDAADWHTDPMEAPTGREGGFALRPGGDDMGPVVNTNARTLLEQIHEIAMAEPRTRLLAGSVEEGRLTYETRSKLWNFPDYTTVSTAEVPGGVTPVINARLRFGKGDMGVNRQRVQEWMAQLDGTARIAQ